MQQSWGSDFEKDCRFKKSATDGPRQTTEWCMGEGNIVVRGGMAIKFKRERTFLFIIFEIGDFGTPLIELRPCNNQ